MMLIIDDQNVYSISCVAQVPCPGVDSDESQSGSGRRHSPGRVRTNQKTPKRQSQYRVRTNQEAGGDTNRTG
jgi:hypothetical protein